MSVNSTQEAFDKNKKSIWLSFYLRAKNHNSNIAIVDKTSSIIYASLLEKVLCLSKQLLNYSGSIFGLLFDHSSEMIAAMLACIKEYKTFVPLLPHWPQKRQKYIITLCEISCLLTDRTNLRQACSLISNALVQQCYDLFFVYDPTNKISPSFDINDMAYILFTSGSTGRPKGVVQNQENIFHHINNYVNALSIGEKDHLSLFSSYTFDAAFMDIFAALISGATLFLYDVVLQGTVSAKSFLLDKKISIFHCVPTLFRSIFFYSDKNKLSDIRYVVLGGEEVVHADVVLFQKNFDYPAILVNGYGPTECTTAFQKKITTKEKVPSRISIGNSLPGIDYELVFDEDHCNYGELIIHSNLAAIGYFKDAIETKKRFKKGTVRRSYITGDLFSKNNRGELVFIGRKDYVVKINGVLIDLLEIESLLRDYPGVEQAVVIFVKQNHTLIGCITSKTLDQSHEVIIKAFLINYLPTSMIPRFIMHLQYFPKTSSGKIDRRMLMRHCRKKLNDISGKNDDKSFAEYQRRLKKLWGNELGRNNFSVHDHFYECGGDSLNVINVIIAIEKEFKIILKISDFILHPTIAKQSAFISTHHFSKISFQGKVLDTSDCLLSYEQLRYWYRLKSSLPSEALNITHSIRMHGKLDIKILKKCLIQLIKSHWLLQVSIVHSNNGPRLYRNKDTKLPFFYKLIQNVSFKSKERVIQELSLDEVSIPFNLQKAPLIRFSLFDLENDEYNLLVTVHHLIADGWSTQILFKEMLSYYKLCLEKQKLPKNNCCTNYYNYIQEQQIGIIKAPQKEFWKKQLRDLANWQFLGKISSELCKCYVQTIPINKKMISKMGKVCKKHRSTMFNVLLTFFRILIWQKTYHTYTCFTTDWSGRENSQYKNTIGLFTNVVPLPFRINPQNSFIQNLLASQNSLNDIFSNLVPLPILLNEIGFKELGNYHTIFPYAFIMQSDKNIQYESIPGISEMEICEIEQVNTSRDMIIEIISQKNNMYVKMVYRQLSFNKSEVKHFLTSYMRLMRVILNDITSPISKVLSGYLKN